jgi:broad specificity phosphatase PhoE
MPNILLIRMGKTIWEEESRVSGNLEVPLLKKHSIEPLLKRLQTLSLEKLFTSPTRAARETAQELAKVLNLQIHLIEELEEFDFGLWQGMLESEISVKHYRTYQLWQRIPSSVCPPFGETLFQCQQRLIQAIYKSFSKVKEADRIGFVLPPYAKAVLDLYFQQKPLDLVQTYIQNEQKISSYRSRSLELLK